MKAASTLSDDTAPSASLGRPKARAAPAPPGAPPEPLGGFTVPSGARLEPAQKLRVVSLFTFHAPGATDSRSRPAPLSSRRHLPISPHISLHLLISPHSLPGATSPISLHISPHLPISPHSLRRHLPRSPRTTSRHLAAWAAAPAPHAPSAAPPLPPPPPSRTLPPVEESHPRTRSDRPALPPPAAVVLSRPRLPPRPRFDPAATRAPITCSDLRSISRQVTNDALDKSRRPGGLAKQAGALRSVSP